MSKWDNDIEKIIRRSTGTPYDLMWKGIMFWNVTPKTTINRLKEHSVGISNYEWDRLVKEQNSFNKEDYCLLCDEEVGSKKYLVEDGHVLCKDCHDDCVKQQKELRNNGCK